MIFKKFLKRLLSPNVETNALMSEKEILEAIDRLPDDIRPKPEKLESKRKPLPYTGKTTKVREPKLYSMFQYLKQADIYGLPEQESDDEDNIAFLIPCGMEWDSSVRVWFVTFPLNGTSEDIIDFYTVVNPLEG